MSSLLAPLQWQCIKNPLRGETSLRLIRRSPCMDLERWKRPIASLSQVNIICQLGKDSSADVVPLQTADNFITFFFRKIQIDLRLSLRVAHDIGSLFGGKVLTGFQKFCLFIGSSDWCVLGLIWKRVFPAIYWTIIEMMIRIVLSAHNLRCPGGAPYLTIALRWLTFQNSPSFTNYSIGLKLMHFKAHYLS